MKYRLAIFDLDGTLLDTLGDLRNAVNHALTELGYPLRTTDEVRTFIGNGVSLLISRSLPDNCGTSDKEEALRLFKEYYGAHIDVETKPYNGVIDMLEALRANGVMVGINSNKYDPALQKLCKKYFDGLYSAAAGESETVAKKPSPDGANLIMKLCGVQKESAIYVGDSLVDIETAKNAGTDSAWVSWGFRTRDEMNIARIENQFDSAIELTGFILGQ